MTTENRKYKWTKAGIKSMGTRSNFRDVWERHVGYSDFEVTEMDSEGRIISIMNEKGSFSANTGEFWDLWCLFLAREIPEKFELIEPEKKEFWTLTIPVNKGMQPFAHGPFDEQEAKDFAVKQIKNAIEGVRVLVLEKSAEAFATYEVK
ncbi:hypothetical protein [Erwinia phage Virsaitis27]|nr:hypothetical protein [Erwinia phage Virsaitis27]